MKHRAWAAVWAWAGVATFVHATTTIPLCTGAPPVCVNSGNPVNYNNGFQSLSASQVQSKLGTLGVQDSAIATFTLGAANTSASQTQVQTRTVACPTGQTGYITQSQTITTDISGATSTGPWTTTSNTCH